MLRLSVPAGRALDPRDVLACAAAGVDPAEAAAPWQDTVAAGGIPPSWEVRRRVEALGAAGLIDPSRRRPGLWHLVLFAWSRPGAPRPQSPAGLYCFSTFSPCRMSMA